MYTEDECHSAYLGVLLYGLCGHDSGVKLIFKVLKKEQHNKMMGAEEKNHIKL